MFEYFDCIQQFYHHRKTHVSKILTIQSVFDLYGIQTRNIHISLYKSIGVLPNWTDIHFILLLTLFDTVYGAFLYYEEAIICIKVGHLWIIFTLNFHKQIELPTS